MSDALEAEARAHFNEPVLFYSKLGRLIGYGEDDHDCYFIAQHMHPDRVTWHSCVGGFMPLGRLKGQASVRLDSGEEWDDYSRLDNLLTLNGAPKVDHFRYERWQDQGTDKNTISPSKPQA